DLLLARARSRSSIWSRKRCALAPTPLAAKTGSARTARATPNKLLHASACRSLAALGMTITEVLVDRLRRVAAFADRPYHERGTAPNIAGSEYTRDVGSVRRVGRYQPTGIGRYQAKVAKQAAIVGTGEPHRQ